MAVQDAGGGHLGVARETTFGTYVTAAKWIPILSENLERKQNNSMRKSIRGLVEAWGVHLGPYHIEGTVKIEVTADAMAWLVYGMRGAVTKTGSVSPFTYSFKPDAGSVSATGRTLSFSVLRAGGGFGYFGCSITSQEYSFENGILVCSLEVIGMGDGAYTPGSVAFAPQDVFGAAENTVKIAGDIRPDITNFSLSVKENAEARNTISGTAAASYIVQKERDVSAKFEIDYDGAGTGATDYSNFSTVAPVTLEIDAVKSATNDEVVITVPQAYYETYPVTLGGLGDLVQAAATLTAVYDATDTDSYKIVVKTTENVA